MRVKNRLSPYPILDNYGDDYINSSFSADISFKPQFSEIYGNISFDLKNDEIKQLIEDKKAKYVVHIECPVTCYRAAFESFDTKIDFKINSDLVADKLEVRTFIILSEDIDNFSSKSFHPDYSGMSFVLSKHQIIAIGTAVDYNINKDDRDIDSIPSIFNITRLKDKKKGTLSVNTDNNDHIIIGLADDVFELYAHLGKNIFKSTAFSLVLFPAMIIVLQRMYLFKDDDSYTSMHWYQVIESLLEKNGFTIDNLDVQTDDLLSICQSIFADPVSRSLKELELFSERI